MREAAGAGRIHSNRCARGDANRCGSACLASYTDIDHCSCSHTYDKSDTNGNRDAFANCHLNGNGAPLAHLHRDRYGYADIYGNGYLYVHAFCDCRSDSYTHVCTHAYCCA